jgi:hypothetical protein
MTERLKHLVDLFQQQLYLPDPGVLLVTLAAVAANRMRGEPVWLLLVGPPGAGKTEVLNSLTQLKFVHEVGDVSVAGLLSGTAEKERASDATGGLLMQIGVDGFGIIVCSDLSGLLDKHREGRAAVLAAYRSVYDGAWTRVLGGDGGRSLSWRGNVGFLGGCTETIDSQHALMAEMGERFVLYRLPRLDDEAEEALARDALLGAAKTTANRTIRSDAVASFFRDLPLGVPDAAFNQAKEHVLIPLATLVARCRSVIVRDSYTRQPELVPQPEAPSRIVKTLGQLYAGMLNMGLGAPEANPRIVEVGLSCLPAIRMRVLEQFIRAPAYRRCRQRLAPLQLEHSPPARRP